jgi:hypothetical protein
MPKPVTNKHRPPPALRLKTARGRTRATHCPHGHEFTEENTRWHRWYTDKSEYYYRTCKQCRLIFDRVKRGIPKQLARTRARQMGKRIEW